jgi:hypothetical protein
MISNKFLLTLNLICISEEPPIFGVSLEEAVSRSRCHDGVPLPLVVRNCLDFIEECGMLSLHYHQIHS